MKCFRFSESKYSVSCLIMMLIKDYLANINKEYEHHVVRLFDKLQMTEQDKVMNERCQAEFAYLEFASKHINYHQNDKGDYIHNIYPSIIIPQNSYKVLDQMRDRNFECSYHFRHVYPYFVSEFGHCHIYKSRYCPTDTKYYTFTNHQSRGLLSKNSFLKAYSHTLRVFLSEIRTYRELYNVSKSGILYNYAVKYTRRGCTRSCLPSYKYGRCAWNNKTNLCGFYITVKYKVKDSVVDSRKRPLEIIHDYNPDDSFKKFVRFVDSYLTVHRFKKYFEKDNQTELIKGITSACELDIAKIIHPPPTIDNQIFKRRKIDV
ncbi:uncharacterized protein RJT21DRAFT_121775 [Scheffersomyces amazonensis]|uniref:uncharacterized protein n=1 Tax=Scheffersomyces amazonensis TaxID=1078765 RepID=UPI00315D6CC5